MAAITLIGPEGYDTAIKYKVAGDEPPHEILARAVDGKPIDVKGAHGELGIVFPDKAWAVFVTEN